MKTVEQEMKVRYWCCLVLYEIPQQNLTNEAYSAHNLESSTGLFPIPPP